MPGLLNVTLGAWLVIGGVLVVQGISHGLAVLPALGGIYVIEPTAFVFVLFAGAAWITFHAIETLDWLRDVDQEELAEVTEALRENSKLKLLSALTLFTNLVVGLAASIGIALNLLSGNLLLGLAVATLYPSFEVTFMQLKRTPASLVLVVALSVSHSMGFLTEIDATEVLDQLAMTPMPNLDNPFLNSASS